MNNNFLQSKEWRKFQESVGRKTFVIEDLPSPPAPLPITGEGGVGFSASIIEYSLPIVGRYFYIPRGPVIPAKAGIQSLKLDSGSEAGMTQLVDLAKKEKAGWIRVEPENEEILEIIKNNINSHLTPTLSSGRRGGYKVVKAPHDMQPKEIFMIDISKSEEEILAEMKSKTRYNIKLSQKHRVSVKAISNFQPASPAGGFSISKKYMEEFLRLNKIMAARQGIETHEDEYYKKMLETIPGDILKLYVAEYQGKIVAANIVIFYGDMATYLHGASDDKYKNVMAPYLLQWRQIQDARLKGCAKYDFGGVKTKINDQGAMNNKNNWQGITRFKLGFSPNIKTLEYPGCYDIIVDSRRYWMYRVLQGFKGFIK